MGERTPTGEALIRGLRAQLVDRLRAELISGRYKEGDAIRQNDVVERYGVSRTPVREALIQLEHEGLVTTVPNRGARVAAEPPDEVQEFLIPIRRVVEVYALRLCFDDLDEDDFEAWKKILDQMRDACRRRDFPAVAEQDIAFHRRIIERSCQPALVTIWSSIVGQIRTHFRRSHEKYVDLMDVYREHAAVVSVFREGSKQQAIRFFAGQIGDPMLDLIAGDLSISSETDREP